MSKWDYRLIRSTFKTGETHISVHEVYYDDDGKITAFTEEPVPIWTDIQEGDDELSKVLDVFDKVVRAADLPILDAETVSREWKRQPDENESREATPQEPDKGEGEADMGNVFQLSQRHRVA